MDEGRGKYKSGRGQGKEEEGTLGEALKGGGRRGGGQKQLPVMGWDEWRAQMSRDLANSIFGTIL